VRRKGASILAATILLGPKRGRLSTTDARTAKAPCYGSGSLRLLWRIVLRLDGRKTQANQGCCGFAVREGKAKNFRLRLIQEQPCSIEPAGSEGIRTRFRPLTT
jgi:hypothetical protein